MPRLAGGVVGAESKCVDEKVGFRLEEEPYQQTVKGQEGMRRLTAATNSAALGLRDGSRVGLGDRYWCSEHRGAGDYNMDCISKAPSTLVVSSTYGRQRGQRRGGKRT